MRFSMDLRWMCAAAFAFVLGCKESTETTDRGTGFADAAEVVDTGEVDSGGDLDASDVDAGSALDAQGSSDSTVAADAGAAQGPVCQELEACCPSLSSLGQNRCFQTAAAWDEAACQTSLGYAQRASLCLPPNHDAGFPGDAGPLGPTCTELTACCPTLPFGQNLCTTNAQSGDEATCQNALDLARRIGYCEAMTDAGEPLDAELPDTGTSTSADAGETLDADTSTVTDAG